MSLAIILGGCSSQPGTDKIDLDSALEASQSETLPALDSILTEIPYQSLRKQPALALQALQAAVIESRWEAAARLMTIIDPAQYVVDDLARYSIAATQYWRHNRQYLSAQRWLDSPRLQNDLPLMKAQDQVLISLMRADILYQLGNYYASAQERMFIEGLLNQPDLIANNATALWNTLLKMPMNELKLQQRRAVGESAKAWLELAIIQHTNQIDISKQAAQAEAWRARWPNHSAAQNLPASIGSLQSLSANRPRVIAALLPLTGPLADGGKAVQDGLAAAYFSALQKGWELPTLNSYDTNSHSVATLYQQAVNDGADLIIGPLQKDKVSELLTMPTNVPIITLNYLANGMPSPVNVVQFGLASEDEAVQLAQAARTNNFRNALIIQSGANWSRRASEAFSKQWRQDGGVILGNTTLSNADNYSAEIENSLGLPASVARLQRIQNIIGKTLVFTPRRRDDIDAIFVFANSKQARSIKPLLAYHYAASLPVYSSSHINDGVKKQTKNRDLNDIVFNEMPWVLESSDIKKQAADRYRKNKNLGRLFAMGVDAFYLHPRIQQLQQAPDSVLQGMTGKLSLQNNRIVRELQLAKFVDGRVKTLKN